MNDDKLKAELISKADEIVKRLKTGKDIELRKTSKGISIVEIRKTVISR